MVFSLWATDSRSLSHWEIISPSVDCLDRIFDAIIVSKLLYASQSWFGYINPLMHEVAVLFQICSEVMSSLGNHSSWLHSFK